MGVDWHTRGLQQTGGLTFHLAWFVSLSKDAEPHEILIDLDVQQPGEPAPQ